MFSETLDHSVSLCNSMISDGFHIHISCPVCRWRQWPSMQEEREASHGTFTDLSLAITAPMSCKGDWETSLKPLPHPPPTEILLIWLSGKESACQCRGCWFNPWVGKVNWRRKWQPTPVFLPGKFHGRKSLAGYSPWGEKSQTRFSGQTTTHQ